MKKRISAFVMACLLVTLTVFSTIGSLEPVNAAGELTMRFHYHREDGDYSTMNSVWLWPADGEGAQYYFEDEDGDQVATMDVPAGTTSIGFIVRSDDWAKDYDEDQFIDCSEMVSGTFDVYVESGEVGYTKEYGGDAVTGTKLKTAVYSDKTECISVTMTGEISGDISTAFSVSGKEGDVAFDTVVYSDNLVYTIKVKEALNVANSYTITFDGTEYPITMPIIYSEDDFESAYTYDGDDLGATYTKDKTTFKVWAPTAEMMYLNLYETGDQDDLIETIEMTPDEKGTWVAEKTGDLNGTYYTYGVEIDGTTTEACDPYARTTGLNGNRAMVIDLDSTDPEGWDQDTNPHAGESINDAIIYEAQIRDITVGDDTGITNQGKFLGLTETGTTTSSGVSTGLDHIKDLGVTHVHILPMYDFGSINEALVYSPTYNWGYDPQNYNVPEGSYSTDPYNGEVRVNECKQMVKAMHDNDLSVVMDVVYNHVYSSSNFCYNIIVPGYFSRISADGSYSNGSGCGNDTASERTMVRKYIVDSVCYWADEYHIDGFRFDLVGLLDTETVNEIVEEVHKTHPDVIFYGEGWEMSTTTTKDDVELATQFNCEDTPGFAFFNDTIRDGIKGNVFDTTQTGYASGADGMTGTIVNAFMGQSAWCSGPSQTINYASCHDNNTLYDRLQISCPDADQDQLIAMNELAASIYMLAEGTPFMSAGEEMLRTKVNEDGSFNDNSYNAGDEVNALDWSSLDDEKYQTVYNYYKGLIEFRKAHGALRLSTADQVNAAVTSVKGLDTNVTAFDINCEGIENETASEIYVIYNPNQEETTITLPDGDWKVCIEGQEAGNTELRKVSGDVTVSAISAMVLVKDSTVKSASSIGSGNKTGLIVGIVAAVVVVAGGLGIGLSKSKKKKSK